MLDLMRRLYVEAFAADGYRTAYCLIDRIYEYNRTRYLLCSYVWIWIRVWISNTKVLIWISISSCKGCRGKSQVLMLGMGMGIDHDLEMELLL